MYKATELHCIPSELCKQFGRKKRLCEFAPNFVCAWGNPLKKLRPPYGCGVLACFTRNWQRRPPSSGVHSVYFEILRLNKLMFIESHLLFYPLLSPLQDGGRSHLANSHSKVIFAASSRSGRICCLVLCIFRLFLWYLKISISGGNTYYSNFMVLLIS